MKTLIIGLGNQGKKRKKNLNLDYVASVDPFNKDAEYEKIEHVDLKIYDSVMLCVPDNKKKELIHYCLKNKKHILVEKPLNLKSSELRYMEKLSKKNQTILYTAYNHRFEPNFINVHKYLNKKTLGKFYSCKMFYGNGTSKLVKNSRWKDSKMGVISDLGSHLLDTVNYFLKIKPKNFDLIFKKKFENKSPDHALFIYRGKSLIQLEVSLCMWRNTFKCDLIFEKGSIHVDSLCKWGPSKFTIRHRKFPSGKPREINKTVISPDPTWKKEYKYFKYLITNKINHGLSKDIWISEVLANLEK